MGEGALNITDAMDTLSQNLYLNQVNVAWLKVAGEIGPTGIYNRMGLGEWFQHRILCVQQYEAWGATLVVPPSVWAPGLFNPQGFFTSICQTTSRAKGLSLDDMVVPTEVSKFVDQAEVTEGPAEDTGGGAYIHGLFMEGARWDKEKSEIAESIPK